jgi:hypothetical protein
LKRQNPQPCIRIPKETEIPSPINPTQPNNGVLLPPYCQITFDLGSLHLSGFGRKLGRQWNGKPHPLWPCRGFPGNSDILRQQIEMNSRILIASLVLLISVTAPSCAETSADMIACGSQPGTCCATIAAARGEVSVIPLEPTTHIGGINTGGLSFSYSDQMYCDTLLGLFHEWPLRNHNM